MIVIIVSSLILLVPPGRTQDLTDGGWKEVQRNVDIQADMETSTLEIKTDSSLGSDETVSMWFKTDSGYTAGGVTLHFTSTPQYELKYCINSRTDFPNDLPSETDKVWRITLIKTSGIRLVIQCNEVEVLNILMSDSTCSYSLWNYYWSRDVEKIRFGFSDSASDHYRLIGSCTELKRDWAMITTTQFPVNPGTVVEVTCLYSDAVNKGSSEVTCMYSTDYSYETEPSCELAGWAQVRRDVYIDVILEDYPFEIKTDSSIGSGEKVRMWFKSDQGDYAGGLFVHFTSPPQYYLQSCNYSTDFAVNLPTETEKVWRISLTRTSGTRLVIHCNEVEVLEFLASDSTCRDSSWQKVKSRKIGQIKFDNDEDTASDYYRGICTDLKTDWTATMETATTFPVNPGTVVEVTCTYRDAVNEGSSLVTCAHNTDYNYDKEPRCDIPGWTQVKLDEYIDADLESSPLEIKTDSFLGSYEKVWVNFYTSEGEYAGGVIFLFLSTLQYWIRGCSNSRTDFPAALMTDTIKVWRISLTRTSGIRLVIHCNNEEVLNFVLSDSTCSYGSEWSDTWNKDIKQIRFEEHDTASDYYTAKCTGLKTEWKGTLETLEPFPVDPGTGVDVTCSNSGHANTGSSQVTCTYYTTYSYDDEPNCEIPVECTGLKTEWTSTIRTATTFPVDPGTVVEVTCLYSDAVNKGSSQVTCKADTEFSYDNEPNCEITDWTQVQRGEFINVDLESSILKIKTDSSLGSNKIVSTWFYTDSGDMAGGVVLIFTDPPHFQIRSCTLSTDFSTQPPTGTDDKVWKITLTRTSGIRLVIHCNEVEVLKFVLSESTCTDSSWSSAWNREVDGLRFDDEDTASDYYRLRVECTGLKTKWTRTIETKTQFPVDPGTVVDVSCIYSGAVNKGSIGVTCTSHTEFSYDDEPSCEIDGWTGVIRYVNTKADLETSILELKTNSPIGSDDRVSMEFKTDGGIRAGGLILHFTSPPQYKIRNCNHKTDFPTTLPTEANKVWRISLRKTTEIRLVIHCNGVEVLNFVLSETNCVDDSGWLHVWNMDVKQIRFDDEDTASDYYRLIGKCTGLKTEWTITMQTTTQFPVDPETIVVLACSDPAAKNEGSSKVTCSSETSFTYVTEPSCKVPVECTGLSTEWTRTIETTTQFPVDPGTVVEVTCIDSKHVNEGSSQVTCTSDTSFTYAIQPNCVIPDRPCKRDRLGSNMNVLPELADYAVGDTATLTCLKAIRYTLFGDKEVSCLSGGEWSGSQTCRKTETQTSLEL